MKYRVVLLLIHSCGLAICHAQQRCNYMEHTFREDITQKSEKYSKMNCTKNKFCDRNYSITYIHFPPYSEKPTLEPRLRACCGKCLNLKVINKFTNISSLNPTTINQSDFILPILGNPLKRTAYGYQFVPICSVPDYLYITSKLDPIFKRLMDSCSSAYPLITICLLMAIVAGFITWLLETRLNHEEFPRSFFQGWFEGIWWSFISMTSVGYGDRTPKSVLGRLFAILWILVGITLFGLLTGILTTAIMSANKPVEPSLKKAKVGVLKYRINDAALVAQHDGSIFESESTNFYDDVVQLIAELREKEIDGILIDKLTYVSVVNDLFKGWMKNDYADITENYRAYTKNNVDYFMQSTITTQKKYFGERLAYGILVKDEEVYEYFRDAIVDNQLTFETNLTLDVARLLRDSHNVDLFSPMSEDFQIVFSVMCTIVATMGVFGLFYTFYRQMSTYKEYKEFSEKIA